MQAERVVAEEAAARWRFWFAVRTVLICLLWQCLGGALVVYAFAAVMPAERAGTLITSGIGIAAGGTLLTVVLRMHRLRGEGFE